MDNDKKERTIGEERVRVDFNPSEGAKNTLVGHIKEETAKLINLCEELKTLDPRLAALAQTNYEMAAMMAVKAATA